MKGRREPALSVWPARDLGTPVVATSLGALYRGDALSWLESLPSNCAQLVVADPPYNLGKAAWDSFPSESSYLEWTRVWVLQAHRALTCDGTLYICGFPEPMAAITAAVSGIFRSHRLLVWFYRNKANLGGDWGRSHESLLHLRKGSRQVFNVDAVRIPYNRHTRLYPEHPQAHTSRYSGLESGARDPARWTPHPQGAKPRDVLEVPTLCNRNAEKTQHPTQKPEELVRRLILASSRPADLVIDPFGGSGTTYAVCEKIGRRWLGCEQEAAYCDLIASRIREPERYRSRSAAETTAQRARRRSLLRGPG